MSQLDGQSASWKRCLGQLKATLSGDEFSNYIEPLKVSEGSCALSIGAPNPYVMSALSGPLRERFQACLEEVYGTGVTVGLQLGEPRAMASEPTHRVRPQPNRGRASASVVEQAQLELFAMERAGRFSASPLIPGNEFPKFLTRVPVFMAAPKAKQDEQLDEDNALPFETPWGKGRRSGPPLTVYDEDTLMALAKLRQNRLTGSPSQMPYPVAQLYGGNDQVNVHVVLCTLSDIQNICGTTKGGRNNQLRLASIRRLANTKIEFTRSRGDKGFSGTSIDLIHVRWDVYEDNATLFIQFSPVLATWLETEFSYIDFNIRKQLPSDVAKAVHRFLSSQPRQYQIHTRKLMAVVGYAGEYKAFMRKLRAGLSALQDLNWIECWGIEGNGRSKPHKLVFTR